MWVRFAFVFAYRGTGNPSPTVVDVPFPQHHNEVRFLIKKSQKLLLDFLQKIAGLGSAQRTPRTSCVLQMKIFFECFHKSVAILGGTWYILYVMQSNL